MGIPHLTRNLIPFSDPCVLQGSKDPVDGVTRTTSVVIDGPSLVHHVFSRLLCNSDPSLHFLEALPTCDQVSRGVMMFLLQLTMVGVTIKEICFDGALPIQKHETRLARLEKARKKIENLRRRSLNETVPTNKAFSKVPIKPVDLFSGRPLPGKFNGLPENPFMVPAVFEDLKTRWDRDNIISVAEEVFNPDSIGFDGFPWAEITVMAPGEADATCARVSKATNCAILTNDSDLLLYDLGVNGSVVLLNSIEMVSWDPSDPPASQIKALHICPATVARRLRIPNLLCLGWEIKRNPTMAMADLTHQLRSTYRIPNGDMEYRLFVKEYYPGVDSAPPTSNMAWDLDTRVSELFCQYELQRTLNPLSETPHVYLAILTEDHTRRCAWTQGSVFRNLGYSILNASRPAHQQFSFVNEVVRRGGRIVVDRVPLGNPDWIVFELTRIGNYLRLCEDRFGISSSSPAYWVKFALCEIYKGMSARNLPDRKHLTRFLTLGCMGETLEWSDIHLIAQVRAVLYSLRVLSQLLVFAWPMDDAVVQIKSSIAGLPPLHIMMRPVHELVSDCLGNSSMDEFVQGLSQMLPLLFVEASGHSTIAVNASNSEPVSSTGGPASRIMRGEVTNLYELLTME